MKSSIYISQHKIDLIGYTGKGKSLTVQDHMTYDLPEGVYINGRIIDQVQLVAGIKSLYKKNPGLFQEVTVIVDGSSIITKKLTVPKLKEKQYYQLIQDDFADSAENFGDLILDYQLIPGEKENQTAMMAWGMDKAEIENYIAVFQEAGIQIHAIRVGVQAIIRYLEQKPELKKQTYVVNVVDGFTMLSMIFDQGVNVFVSRTRLYGETREQISDQLVENLSGLLQFNRSQQFAELEYSYYLGLSEEELLLLSERNNLDITIKGLELSSQSKDKVNLPYNTHFAYMGALLPKDSVNFIARLKHQKKVKQTQGPSKRLVLTVAGIILVVGIPTVYFGVNAVTMNREIKSIKEYINSTTVVEKVNELDEITAETNKYTKVASDLDQLLEVEQTRVAITKEILNVVTTTNEEKTAISILQYDKNTGVIRVNGESASEDDSSQYVEALKQYDQIGSILYTGYSYSSDGRFHFSIEIKLQPKEEIQ